VAIRLASYDFTHASTSSNSTYCIVYRGDTTFKHEGLRFSSIQHIHIHTYIASEREREREREKASFKLIISAFSAYRECSHACSNYVFFHNLLDTPWPESTGELCRPSDRRLSATLVPTFANWGCHVVSVTDPYGCILRFLDQSHYFFFQIVPQLYSRGWADPDLWIYSHELWSLDHRGGPICWIH
jgi:hypothetical protein